MRWRADAGMQVVGRLQLTRGGVSAIGLSQDGRCGELEFGRTVSVDAALPVRMNTPLGVAGDDATIVVSSSGAPAYDACGDED